MRWISAITAAIAAAVILARGGADVGVAMVVVAWFAILIAISVRSRRAAESFGILGLVPALFITGYCVLLTYGHLGRMVSCGAECVQRAAHDDRAIEHGLPAAALQGLVAIVCVVAAIHRSRRSPLRVGEDAALLSP